MAEKQGKKAGGSEAKIKSPTMMPKVIRKNISLVRRDIENWRTAVRQASMIERPKQVLLQDLYDELMLDNHLTSQVNNRFEQTISCPFEMFEVSSGKVDDALTDRIAGEIEMLPDMIGYVLDSLLYGYSVVEIGDFGDSYRQLGQSGKINSGLGVQLIPRQNIEPVFGRFFPDSGLDSYIEYRAAAEYGRTLLEFRGEGLGMLNKLTAPVLYKKFAFALWSELCEIYGIPPRYMKTNTQNADMLDQAEKMMREMGSAAWFIIDTTEEFQFAQGVTTNGDVYRNLIKACTDEISLLLNGAIIGQDTVNGNYSKEQSNQVILARLVESDRRYVERTMNKVVIPALMYNGLIPVTDCKFRFAAVESNDSLWQITKELLPYKEVDSKWITEKFNIPVTDKGDAQEVDFAVNGSNRTGYLDDSRQLGTVNRRFGTVSWRDGEPAADFMEG